MSGGKGDVRGEDMGYTSVWGRKEVKPTSRGLRVGLDECLVARRSERDLDKCLVGGRVPCVTQHTHTYTYIYI